MVRMKCTVLEPRGVKTLLLHEDMYGCMYATKHPSRSYYTLRGDFRDVPFVVCDPIRGFGCPPFPLPAHVLE